MDFLNKFVTKGTVTAVLSVAAILAGAFGYAPLKGFFEDPHTADAILTAAGAIGTLAAGIMQGVKKD